MGAIMAIGVATANSILVVSFANDERCGDNPKSSHDAALSAGFTRLRPVVMTALAMIIGMLPFSFGLGEGGEQNAPLGRAVIGGLILQLSPRCFSCRWFTAFCEKRSLLATKTKSSSDRSDARAKENSRRNEPDQTSPAS